TVSTEFSWLDSSGNSASAPGLSTIFLPCRPADRALLNPAGQAVGRARSRPSAPRPPRNAARSARKNQRRNSPFGTGRQPARCTPPTARAGWRPPPGGGCRPVLWGNRVARQRVREVVFPAVLQGRRQKDLTGFVGRGSPAQDRADNLGVHHVRQS